MWPFTSNYPSKYRDEVKRLTSELIEIGKRNDFLSEHPGGEFDSQCRHARARQIGMRLNEIGDIALMESICKKVSKKCGKDIAAHLEFCWLRVGKF